MIDLRYEAATRILHVRVEGQWSLPTFLRHSVSAMAQGTALRLRHGLFATLVDARAFPVQAGEVAASMNASLAKMAAISTAPAATVMSSPLGAMQARRILTMDHWRVFLDHDEAVAWLDEQWVGPVVRGQRHVG